MSLSIRQHVHTSPPRSKQKVRLKAFPVHPLCFYCVCLCYVYPFILPCTDMTWRSRKPFHFGSRSSYSSQQAGWSLASWRSSGSYWAPHRPRSQTPHLAWCCSAAPQTAAWTGWPEAAASAASRWTSGGEKRGTRSWFVCCHIDSVCVCSCVWVKGISFITHIFHSWTKQSVFNSMRMFCV